MKLTLNTTPGSTRDQMFSFFCLFRLWSDVAVQEFAQFHLNRSKTYKAGTTDELLKGWLSSSTHPLGSRNIFFSSSNSSAIIK